MATSFCYYGNSRQDLDIYDKSGSSGLQKNELRMHFPLYHHLQMTSLLWSMPFVVIYTITKILSWCILHRKGALENLESFDLQRLMSSSLYSEFCKLDIH